MSDRQVLNAIKLIADDQASVVPQSDEHWKKLKDDGQISEVPPSSLRQTDYHQVTSAEDELDSLIEDEEESILQNSDTETDRESFDSGFGKMRELIKKIAPFILGSKDADAVLILKAMKDTLSEMQKAKNNARVEHEEADYDKMEGIYASKKKTANDVVKDYVKSGSIIIAIEWKTGETRKYKDGYSQVMQNDYGYVVNTTSSDGEEIDVYLGTVWPCKTVYQIEQLKDGEFDEYKYMAGFRDDKDATGAYFKHMPFENFGSIKELTWEEFESLVHTSDEEVKTAMKRTSARIKWLGVEYDAEFLRNDSGTPGEGAEYGFFDNEGNAMLLSCWQDQVYMVVCKETGGDAGPIDGKWKVIEPDPRAIKTKKYRDRG